MAKLCSKDSSLTDEEAEEHEEAACQADLRTSLPEARPEFPAKSLPKLHVSPTLAYATCSLDVFLKVEALKAAAIRHLAALAPCPANAVSFH